MKIKEVTERECCEEEDMIKIESDKFKCKYCEKIYVKEYYCDAAGDTDTRYADFNEVKTMLHSRHHQSRKKNRRE